MEKVDEFLKKLDLSDVEIKLYKGLMEVGPTTILELSKYTNIKRATAHFNIESLIEKGLVSQTVSGSRRQIVAESPQRLNLLLEQKISEIETLQKEMPEIINAFSKPNSKSQPPSDMQVKYYEGKKGVKYIYQDALNSKELRSYVNLAQVNSFFPENKELFIQAQKKNKDLTIYEIVESSDTANNLTSQFSSSTKYFYKFTPHSIKLSAADILIYDGKVAVINISQISSGMIFSNENYYSNSKAIFDFLWNII